MELTPDMKFFWKLFFLICYSSNGIIMYTRSNKHLMIIFQPWMSLVVNFRMVVIFDPGILFNFSTEIFSLWHVSWWWNRYFFSVSLTVIGAFIAGARDLSYDSYGYAIVFVANITTAVYLATVARLGNACKLIPFLYLYFCDSAKTCYHYLTFCVPGKSSGLNSFGLMWCNGNNAWFLSNLSFGILCCLHNQDRVLPIYYKYYPQLFLCFSGVICAPLLLVWTSVSGDLERTIRFPHLYSPGFLVLPNFYFLNIHA